MIGYLFGLGFCIATALSTTMIHGVSTVFGPFFSLFCTTLLGIIYFNVVNISKLREIYCACFQEKYLWILISLCVSGNWITTFYALSQINPFVFLFTYFSSSAIVGAFFQYLKTKQHASMMIAILLLLMLFIFFEFHHVGYSFSLVAGISSAIASAFFGYGYRRTSVTFSQKTKLSATGVLAVRFYLLLLIAFILSLMQKQFGVINLHVGVQFIVLSVVTFLIPLYCMQRSVLLIGAEYFSILTSLCPAITAILMLYHGQVHTVFYIFSLTLFIISLMKKFTPSAFASRLAAK